MNYEEYMRPITKEELDEVTKELGCKKCNHFPLFEKKCYLCVFAWALEEMNQGFQSSNRRAKT